MLYYFKKKQSQKQSNQIKAVVITSKAPQCSYEDLNLSVYFSLPGVHWTIVSYSTKCVPPKKDVKFDPYLLSWPFLTILFTLLWAGFGAAAAAAAGWRRTWRGFRVLFTWTQLRHRRLGHLYILKIRKNTPKKLGVEWNNEKKQSMKKNVVFFLNTLLFVMNGKMHHFLLQGNRLIMLLVSQLSLYSWSAGNWVPLRRWDPTPDSQVQPCLKLWKSFNNDSFK